MSLRAGEVAKTFELTEENKAIEDHAAGIAGEEDTDCPVEHCELWSVDGVCWDVHQHD